jgi:SAM-dependent methyltransferase
MSGRTEQSYGQHGLTFIDRLGAWLSQRAIRRHLPKRSNLEVLDLGCGYHATELIGLEPFLKRGVGVDFQLAPELQRLARYNFHEGSIEDALVRLKEEKFDVVMLISVLEHLSAPGVILESAREMLKPSGVLIVNVPTWRGKAFLEFSAFRLGLSPKVEMDDHKMYYDKRDLWPLLVRAGFKPSQIRLRYHKFGLNLLAAASK